MRNPELKAAEYLDALDNETQVPGGMTHAEYRAAVDLLISTQRGKGIIAQRAFLARFIKQTAQHLIALQLPITQAQLNEHPNLEENDALIKLRHYAHDIGIARYGYFQLLKDSGNWIWWLSEEKIRLNCLGKELADKVFSGAMGSITEGLQGPGGNTSSDYKRHMTLPDNPYFSADFKEFKHTYEMSQSFRGFKALCFIIQFLKGISLLLLSSKPLSQVLNPWYCSGIAISLCAGLPIGYFETPEENFMANLASASAFGIVINQHFNKSGWIGGAGMVALSAVQYYSHCNQRAAINGITEKAII